MADTSETTRFDPRYERAQTIDGAKARYVNVDGYTLSDLESDVERILIEGEGPDRNYPEFEGQEAIRG